MPTLAQTILPVAIIELGRKRLGIPRVGSQSVPNSVSKVCAQVTLLAFSFRLKDGVCVCLLRLLFQGMTDIAAATPGRNLRSPKCHPNRGDDRAVYIRCGARTDWTANICRSGCRAFTDWRFGKFVCFNIDSELESERRTQGSQVHDIPDRSLVPPRMFVATLVESRFAAQTRCKSRCEVAAEATLHHVK